MNVLNLLTTVEGVISNFICKPVIKRVHVHAFATISLLCSILCIAIIVFEKKCSSNKIILSHDVFVQACELSHMNEFEGFFYCEIFLSNLHHHLNGRFSSRWVLGRMVENFTLIFSSVAFCDMMRERGWLKSNTVHIIMLLPKY